MQLYTVVLKYRSIVTANSATDAYQVMENNIRSCPGMYIVSVEEGGERPKKRPLWKRLIGLA